MSAHVAEQKFVVSGRSILFIVAGCVAYVLAKSMTSAGKVTLDQIEYWILGLAPFILIGVYTYVIRKVFVREEPSDESTVRFYASAWLCALIAFIILRETQYSDAFQLPLYRKFGFENSFLDLAFSIMYVVLGTTCCFALAFMRTGKQMVSLRKVISLVGLAILNSLMFYVLVF